MSASVERPVGIFDDDGKPTVNPTESAKQGARSPNPWVEQRSVIPLVKKSISSRNTYMVKWKRGNVWTLEHFVFGEGMTCSISE